MTDRAPFAFPRAQSIPGVGRTSLRIDGVERVGYEEGVGRTRPFLFPIVGPSGAWLTRMGDPGSAGPSTGFGHPDVGGVDFRRDAPEAGDAKVRHRRVVGHLDAPDRAGLVVELDWWAHGAAILRQNLTILLSPRDDGGLALDLQSRFEAAAGPVALGLGESGFLGVRVARTMSERSGGGRMLDSAGRRGAAIPGRPARWVDASGPSAPATIEGIAVLDHPDNPRHPTPWHARPDGSFGPAFNRDAGWAVVPGHPLDLRYRVLVHAGPADPSALDSAWDEFAATPPAVGLHA